MILNLSSFLKPIVQPEDVIVDVVVARRRRYKMEEFTKVQRIITTNLHASSYKNVDGVGIVGWLNVHGLYHVLNLAKTNKLCNDSLRTLDLCSFKC